MYSQNSMFWSQLILSFCLWCYTTYLIHRKVYYFHPFSIFDNISKYMFVYTYIYIYLSPSCTKDSLREMLLTTLLFSLDSICWISLTDSIKPFFSFIFTVAYNCIVYVGVVYEYLGCFQAFAIINNTTVSSLMHISFSIFAVFFGVGPWERDCWVRERDVCRIVNLCLVRLALGIHSSHMWGYCFPKALQRKSWIFANVKGEKWDCGMVLEFLLFISSW